MDYMEMNVRPEGEPIAVYGRQQGRTQSFVDNAMKFLTTYSSNPLMHEKETKAVYSASPYSPYIRQLYSDTMITRKALVRAKYLQTQVQFINK